MTPDPMREALAIANEAVYRLTRIGDIYSSWLCADITDSEAGNRIEGALRGDPPEGEIRHYVLREALDRLTAESSP